MTNEINTPDLLLALVHKMQSAASNYLEPATYVRRRPGGTSRHDSEIEMPAYNHSESQVRIARQRRDAMFINDLIYMLDGPEQRAAEATHTRPAPAVTDQARIAAMTITNSTIQAHQIVSDVRSEKTDPLQPYVPHNVVLSALSAIQPEAPSELDTLRETNRLLHRRTQEAESNAYRDAGRWKRRSKRNQQMMNHAFEQSRRYRDVIGPLKIKIASLEFSIRTRSEVRDEALREAAQKIISDTENTLNGLSANAAEICERTILALIDQPAPAPQTVQEAVDVLIQTMRLSGNREEYYVRIACGGRTIETRRYTQGFKNRAEYEVDELRHVLLNEPKPDLLDPKYADPKPDTPPTEGE